MRAAPRGRHVSGQLEPLSFAARERVGRLPEPQIVEPHVDQLLETDLHLGTAAEKCEGFADGHIEDFGDVAAAVGNVEDFLAVAPAVALAAFHVHVGQELHVDLDVAVAVAHAAAPSFDIEAEVAGRVVARAGFERVGEHGPNLVEGLDVRHRVGARRAADRALIDENHVVDLTVAEDVVEVAGRGASCASAG